MQETIVKFENVTMQFPGVLANDNVSFDIRKGEIFALVGENGAGKSTLMNILYGINTPTSGNVYIKGSKMEKHRHGARALYAGSLFYCGAEYRAQ